MYITWCELVYFREFNEQSRVILWVNWFKNKSFWKSFTCNDRVNILNYKFKFSEKARTFWKILYLLWRYWLINCQNKWDFFSNAVAFSQFPNFSRLENNCFEIVSELMSFVAHRFGRLEFQVLNVEYCFLQAVAIEKSK